MPRRPSIKRELEDLGLIVDEDGLVSLVLLVGISGQGFAQSPGEKYRCKPRQAVDFVRKHIARPRRVKG